MISLILIILILGATTGFSKELYLKKVSFSGNITKENFRMYDVRWLHEKENAKTFLCGTELTTLDYSGRKFVFAFLLILLDTGEIVSRFSVEGIQISIDKAKPPYDSDSIESESLQIKIHGAKMSFKGKDRFGGMRNPESIYKSFDAQFNEFTPRDIEDIKIMYRGEYDLHVMVLPEIDFLIPVIHNPKHSFENEKYIDNCVSELIKNKEFENQPKGEISSEKAKFVG